MDQSRTFDLYMLIKDRPSVSVFGPYVLTEAPMVAVVLVECSREIAEATIFIYSDLGYGPTSFMKYEYIVLPIGGETIFKYELEDEIRLGLTATIPCGDLGDDEFWENLDFEDTDLLAESLCPLLSKLIPFDESDIKPDHLYQFNKVGMAAEYPGLFSGDAPDFWK
mgnify:CR=1 FL=1